MKVSNEGKRAILACINPTNSDNPGDLEWFEIPPGESIEVENYKVASTLVEYGAKAAASELAAARELWAEKNRLQNSRIASASASEGQILGRQQATVDVATGTATGTGEGLRGAALDEAVRAAREAGAEIDPKGTADARRKGLADWQALQGASTLPEESGRYVLDENGGLFLDDDGQPVELVNVQVDEDGRAVLDDDGNPVPVETVGPSSTTLPE